MTMAGIIGGMAGTAGTTMIVIGLGKKVWKQPAKSRQQKWTKVAHVFIIVALTLIVYSKPLKLDCCFGFSIAGFGKQPTKQPGMCPHYDCTSVRAQMLKWACSKALKEEI